MKQLEGDNLKAEQLFAQADALLGLEQLDDSGCGMLTIKAASETHLLRTTADLPAASCFDDRRFCAKKCFPAVDFIETTGTCSNATVSSAQELLLLGKGTADGLLPLIRRLHPQLQWTKRAAIGQQHPVSFLWLVPPLVFEESRAGLMVIETAAEPKPSESTKVNAIPAAEVDSEAARALAPWVVQYAVVIPPPSGDLRSSVCRCCCCTTLCFHTI
jgi:hypothetical protein